MRQGLPPIENFLTTQLVAIMNRNDFDRHVIVMSFSV